MESKRIFLKAVCLFYLWSIVLILIVGKICDCNSEDKTPAVPVRSAPSKPSKSTAADILGLRQQQQPSANQALSPEREVDQYLSNPDTGSDTITFWQVVLILTPCTLISSLTYITGTSTSISSHFPSCNGYYTHPSFKCAL